MLTVDPKDYRDAQEAYLALYPAFSALMKRIRRRWGPTSYVAVIEQHKSGWPHLNVILTGQAAAECQGDGWRAVRKVLGGMATGTGFGVRIWIEPVRKRDAAALYIAKLAGETAKASQVPVEAPKGFRRLRASRGFLPPVQHDPDVTGEVVFRPLEQCGDPSPARRSTAGEGPPAAGEERCDHRREVARRAADRNARELVNRATSGRRPGGDLAAVPEERGELVGMRDRGRGRAPPG